MQASFMLSGRAFMAMDSGLEHAFTFTEAMSLLIDCASQDEVDYFWEKLSDGGETSQCGWLKEKFGLSWQVVPTVLVELMQDDDPEKANKVTQAMLQMTKIDISKLKEAYERN
jgi:predicted 3-demethylubiquinone-9 3-methyltransferase (glyoxalase superfamily)